MSFPVITPSFYKEIVGTDPAAAENDFSSVVLSPAAAEYVLNINNPDVVRKLIETTDRLAFNMAYAEGEAEEEMRKYRDGNMLDHPIAEYYWQFREFMMYVLQDKSIIFESRMLILNYAMKTVQGMIDQHHPELIPKFLADYLEGNVNPDEVLKFFNGLAPNPPYALTDGISFLKSLVKADRGYKDTMNKVYSNLGVSGPETLNLIDVKKYLDMRRIYSDEFMKENSHRVENIMVNFVWSYSVPFACCDRLNIWDNFVFFNSLYNALKILITCSKPYDSDDDFIKAVSSFGKALIGAGKDSVWKAVHVVKSAGQATNGDMAILTIS